MEDTTAFEAERPRLLRLAGQILHDPVEAQDVVQQAWLRLNRNSEPIGNLPGWLTTVTSRLCLDRLRRNTPTAEPDADLPADVPDPADQVALAGAVGIALQVVLARLTPHERVAFVLHDSFGVDFPTIAAILDTTAVAARKLASRARGKVAFPAVEGLPVDWQVVDAFLAAARKGDFAQLLALLAPDVVVVGDEAATLAGTPARVAGRHDVAAMFNGAAKAALPVFVEGRPGAAWFHRGEARVAFDFTVSGGMVVRIDFRADPGVLSTLSRRNDNGPMRETKPHR